MSALWDELLRFAVVYSLFRDVKLNSLAHVTVNNLQIYRYVDAVVRYGSIRKAAEQLAITPSALNRRILALEDELGVPLFERLGRGMRLSAAGELMVHMFRRQLAEVEQVKSQIADLSGLRRGDVAIACSQALLPYVLPEQIKTYQSQFPSVTFNVMVQDAEEAEKALLDYRVDLAIIFEPLRHSEFLTLLSIRQPIHAVMARDHPLACRTSIKLSDCLMYPLALPARPYAVRNVLETAADQLLTRLSPLVEADSYIFLRNFVVHTPAIAFELVIGVPPGKIDNSIVSIPVELPGAKVGSLHVAQLKGRTLSVAASRFANQLTSSLRNADPPSGPIAEGD